MLNRYIDAAIVLMLGILTLAGCGPERATVVDIPEPGTATLISVTPVEPDQSGGLVSNGDFSTWYAGLTTPVGFSAPKNEQSSVVERDRMWGHLGTSGFSARQTWFDFATNETPDAGFSTTVSLEANRRYQVDVVAAASPGMVASMGAYAIDGDGALTTLNPHVVEIVGESPARYSGFFHTRTAGSVLLSSQISPLAAQPGVITWSEWAIHPAPAAAENRQVLVDVDYWMQSSLDHVRSQLDLYGGAKKWSDDLYNLHKNLGRIYREAEGTRGNAVRGYNDYVFQKTELNYVLEVVDFVHTVNEDRTAYRPAFQALLRLDRAMTARGKQLIVVPVPDRIHLYADQMYPPAASGPPSYLAHTGLLKRLLEEDVLAIDVAPLLNHRRFESNVVYWRTDYGVPSYTLSEIARYVAPLMAEMEGAVVTLTPSEEMVTLMSRAVPGLNPPLQKGIAAEESRLLSVRDEAGKAYQAVSEGPILVVGSLASLYTDSGASLAAQLAGVLGMDTAVLPEPLLDQEVPAYLIENTTPAIEAARVVLFSFPEFALVRPGW